VSELVGHVVLCGLEALSVRTLEELERTGERVIVVALGGERRHREVAERLAEGFVTGDPREPEVLEAAQLGTARAIVFTANDDVGNIHAALVARQVAPGIHIVVRTFDEEFGRRVESLLPDAVALSASALAAPGFVSTILGEEDERIIEVAGRTLALARESVSESAVVAVVSDDADPPRILPDPASLPADARPLCLVDAGGAPGTVTPKLPRRAIPGTRPGIGWIRRVDRRFWAWGGLLALITLGSAVIIELATGDSLVYGIYNTVSAFFGGVDPSIVTTDALRLFAVVLTLVGALAVAIFYGLIADTVLSARLSTLLGPRPTDAADHVIVVGLGTIGYRIVLALRARGIRVAAVEQQEQGRFVAAARELGIPVVIGDAADPANLRTLRIDRARGLVAATDHDPANLATAMHARGLRPDLRIVVRLFDPDLADQLGRAFGEFRSRSVSALAAPAFAAAAISRRVVATIPVGHRRVLVIARVPIAAGSPAAGSTVGEEESAAAEVELGAARVLAIVRGDDVIWKPDRDQALDAGDDLVLLAPRRSLAVAVQRGSSRAEQRGRSR
jgi:Trk K+ transport system NAD-binding subunit